MGCKSVGEALVVNVGDDSIDDDELRDLQGNAPLGVAVVKVIYWYESSAYDGDGTIVYQDSCHKWHIDSLSHNSCYGPCDRFCATSYSLSDIKKLLKKEDYYENGGKEILSYLDGKRF